jgi:hypothetical protein
VGEGSILLDASGDSMILASPQGRRPDVNQRRTGRSSVLVLLVALVAILTVGWAFLHQHNATQDNFPGGPAAKLRWAPPRMTSPKTIMIQSGLDPDRLHLSLSQDYVLKMPAGGVHGTVEIDGGHNVTLIGGSVTVPSTANQSDNGRDNTDTAIYIRHSTGTVHIEGVLINADQNVEYDGIDVNAPRATVQVENVRMEAIYGSRTTEHADAIQTWGGVKVLDVDNLTADGDYQGLTINPNLGTVGKAYISNVDLTDDQPPGALASRTVGGGVMLWLTTTTGCDAPKTSLGNVYIINEHSGLATRRTVWPSTTGDPSCAGLLKGNKMSWPRLPVTGSVTFGRPQHGSFVPAGVAGGGYRSPGYIAGH